MINFACPICGKHLEFADATSGTTANCSCGELIRVPITATTKIAGTRTGRRRRWLPWVVRITAGLALLILVGAVSLFIFREVKKSQGEMELAAALEETTRTDPRWRWEQIEEDRTDVPNPENSIRVIHEINNSMGGWDPQDLKIPHQDSELPWPANVRLDEHLLNTIRQDLRNQTEIVLKAASLVRFPRGRAHLEMLENPINIQVPHVGECRKVVAILELDVERLLHEKNTRDALERVLAILNSSDGLTSDPFVISMIIRMGIRRIAVRKIERILAMTTVPDDALRKMQEACSFELNNISLSAVVRTERASAHHFFENLEAGKLTLAALGNQPANSKLQYDFFMYWPKVKHDHAVYLRAMTKAMEIASLALPKQKTEWSEQYRRISDKLPKERQEDGEMLTGIFYPLMPPAFNSYQRDRALFNCAIVILALERYRLAHNRWPEQLESLRPEYLRSVPLDPYDDEPVKYLKRADGVTVYTCGPDCVDNGGRSLSNLKSSGGTDIGLELWNPDQRGLPAVPKKKNEEQP